MRHALLPTKPPGPAGAGAADGAGLACDAGCAGDAGGVCATAAMHNIGKKNAVTAARAILRMIAEQKGL